MPPYKRMLLAGLALLSLQGSVQVQAALAHEISSAAPGSGLPATRRSQAPASADGPDQSYLPYRLRPGEVSSRSSDDFDLFCCLPEILLIVGLVGIGVLGANAVIWLIEQNDKSPS